jgi:hypothetical protein
MMNAEEKHGFFKKYKKWFIALIGLQLIPLILLVCAVIGSIVYSCQ